MSGVESVGEAVSGALAGRAVEPEAGEVGRDGHTHERNCLNCETRLAGDYCHVCGQRAHVHRTLSAFFHDLVHGVLHLDGKIFRTLPLLALRPGELTRRYIDGERAKFVSPLALFLFSVFLMFAILGSALHLDDLNVKTNVSQLQKEEQASLDRLEAQRAAAAAQGKSTAALDRQIAQTKDTIGDLQKIDVAAPDDVRKLQLSSDLEFLRAPITKAIQNPDLLLYKVRTSAYKWSWLLIPISIPFLWLLFPFSRRFRLYDHTVFVTYSLSFMTMLVVAAAASSLLSLGGVGILALFVVPVHFYLQLKGTYGLSRISALWRTLALTLLSVVALSIFATLMFVFGVL